VKTRRLVHHQLGRSHRGKGFGDRELNTSVLTDWATKEDALVGIVGRFLMNHLASPMHSDAIRIRSAFMPERI
jgi:hypothetical protein